MALRYAVLIALQETPATGYEITKYFDQGMGHFWHSSHQQIYLELRKMADTDLVQFETIAQTGKPDKKVYHITQQGMQALQQWLAKPAKHSAVKDSLLMKIYAGPLGKPKNLLAEVERHRSEYQKLLSEFYAIEQQWFQNIEQQPSQYRYIYLTLRNGIISVEAWLQWSEEVLQFLTEQVKSSEKL